jgi:hypothetical protein
MVPGEYRHVAPATVQSPLSQSFCEMGSWILEHSTPDFAAVDDVVDAVVAVELVVGGYVEDVGDSVHVVDEEVVDAASAKATVDAVADAFPDSASANRAFIFESSGFASWDPVHMQPDNARHAARINRNRIYYRRIFYIRVSGILRHSDKQMNVASLTLIARIPRPSGRGVLLFKELAYLFWVQFLE